MNKTNHQEEVITQWQRYKEQFAREISGGTYSLLITQYCITEIELYLPIIAWIKSLKMSKKKKKEPQKNSNCDMISRICKIFLNAQNIKLKNKKKMHRTMLSFSAGISLVINFSSFASNLFFQMFLEDSPGPFQSFALCWLVLRLCPQRSWQSLGEGEALASQFRGPPGSLSPALGCSPGTCPAGLCSSHTYSWDVPALHTCPGGLVVETSRALPPAQGFPQFPGGWIPKKFQKDFEA